MSNFLRHAPCPECGSKNNLGIYDDHEHCFGCGYDKQYGDKTIEESTTTKKVKERRPESAARTRPLTPISKKVPTDTFRHIEPASFSKYLTAINLSEEFQEEALFPRFSDEGEHVANQVRYKDKKFAFEGDADKCVLFGQNFFPEGGRSITVTEGYYDTLSAFQLTGSRYPNVGVMSAATAKKEIVRSFEYLNSFDRIVINFDSDEPGQKAAKEVAQLFEPGKVCILKLDKAKDANEYLVNGWVKEYTNEWFRAPPYMPDGLLLGTQLWGDIINHSTPRSIPYPWSELNRMTYGIRLSEIVLLTAETGVGKTSVVKAIEHALLTNEILKKEDAGVGFLHLEETKYDTAIGLMSIHARKPYHLPDVERTEQELRKAYDEVINTDRVVIWDSFGSNDVDVVLAKIRHMAALGCKYIVLDHLSIVVSDQHGDERKQLDEISTKLKTLCMNLNIAVIAVIHLNRAGEIRGSAGPEQIANIVVRLERDKKAADAWRRNVTKLTVEKNRFCGRTGPSSYLFYDEITGTLSEMEREQVEAFEQGGSVAGHEFQAYSG